jgi:hypothetical protein
MADVKKAERAPVFDKDALKAEMQRNKTMIKKAKDRQKKAPPGTAAPDFWNWLEDAEFDNAAWDNLDDTGSIEANSNAENGVMSEALRRIIAEKQERRRKYALLADASYYCVLVFQTVDQKEAFLKAKHWDKIDGNFQNVHLNGLEIADLEGVPIEPVYIPTRDAPEAPKDLRSHPIIGDG